LNNTYNQHSCLGGSEMKKDITTPIGIVLGIGLILFGILSGGSIMLFIQASGLAITVGGSFAGVLISYPMSQIKNMFKISMQAFNDNTMASIDIINKFTNLSRKARREGLLSLEDEINGIDDKFLKKGLQMVVDGIEPEIIKDVMDLEIGEMEKRHEAGASVLVTWAALAPGFGMIGTLIGLIQMIANMADPSALSGMATALLTTFYGSLLANLILIPMSTNLNYKSSLETSNKEMMLEGILAIQSGVNPRIVEEKLIAYLSTKEKLEYQEAVNGGGEVTENV
jgi:chemotaxis protein MotA